MSEFFELGEPLDAAELQSPLSRQLIDALRADKEFELLGIRTCQHGVNEYELLVVDAWPDGIFPYNEYGILCRERLAIRLARNQRALPKVLTLRKDFPVLMHLNSTAPGSPRDMCLYESTPIAAMRRWTARSFLERIKHWLRASAAGTLHPPDQPIEPLFFRTRSAVVLPDGFEQRAEAHASFSFITRPARLRTATGWDEFTLFLAPDSTTAMTPRCAGLLLELPQLEHGLIESPGYMLGELSGILGSRGYDLYSHLNDALYLYLEKEGKSYLDIALDKWYSGSSASGLDEYTLLLLKVPLIRPGSSSAAPEVRVYAFMVGLSPAALGKTLGLVASANPNDASPNDWVLLSRLPGTRFVQEQSITDVSCYLLEVQRELSSAAARQFSGMADDCADDVRVLLGAGALGSHLLDNWLRMGWGTWLLVDHDTLKPHNLVRHTALADMIGRAKAEAMASYANDLLPGRIVDVHTQELSSLSAGSFAGTSLVVDATASLDATRSLSVLEGLVSRCAAVFFNPRGTAAVLMIEDASRQHPLHALEPQYWRAVLTEPWGVEHLLPVLGRFRTGYGCSDISHVLCNADVSVLSGILARQLPQYSQQLDSALVVWSLDAESGELTRHPIASFASREFHDKGTDFAVVIDEFVLEKMRQLRHASLPNETGGILVGYHDFNLGRIFVVDACSAPPDSKANPTEFVRGKVGVVETLEMFFTRSCGQIIYIGEWHSHLGGSTPSSLDRETLDQLALIQAEEGLPAVMTIVGAEVNDVTVRIESRA